MTYADKQPHRISHYTAGTPATFRRQVFALCENHKAGVHSQTGIFLRLLIISAVLARTPGSMNTENVLRQQLLTLHLTWETCGNLWHLAESAHTQHTSTLCRGRYQPDRTLLRPRGLHALRHAHTHKHTHTRGS